MTKTILHDLYDVGQSVWLDNISRSLIESGELKSMIQKGLTGLTSNPSIFDKSISSGPEYDNRIEELYSIGKTPFATYDELTVKDVQDAADLFKSVYEKTRGKDGYVSLEVNPKLARKKDETVAECKRLYAKVNRPNVMFKIPATGAGFSAVEDLLAEGININVTLIFSLEQYINTAHAFLCGLERLAQTRNDLSNIASVASVFVSRVDNVVDKILEDRMKKEKDVSKNYQLGTLKGKAAVANAKVIFEKYQEIFSKESFKELERKGAYRQRVLWGSTSTKNPAYSDMKYITELIGKNTVNTIPDKTLLAFLDHGVCAEALTGRSQDAKDVLKKLAGLGIDVDKVCDQLLKEGLDAFERSFESLLKTIETKAGALGKQKSLK